MDRPTNNGRQVTRLFLPIPSSHHSLQHPRHLHPAPLSSYQCGFSHSREQLPSLAIFKRFAPAQLWFVANSPARFQRTWERHLHTIIQCKPPLDWAVCIIVVFALRPGDAYNFVVNVVRPLSLPLFSDKLNLLIPTSGHHLIRARIPLLAVTLFWGLFLAYTISHSRPPDTRHFLRLQ